MAQFPDRRSLLPAAALLLLPLGLASCNANRFPSYPPGYREFAYVTDGASDTVAVLDLVYLRQDRVLQVGHDPMGLAVNTHRNEVYAVNTGGDSVSVIDAEKNEVAATIGVHRTPHFIDVDPNGKRAYVANSGSNTVSVLDLEKRREIAVAATGEQPWQARVAPDNRTLVVSNHAAGSVSVYSIGEPGQQPLQLRNAFAGCAGATDVVILPDSSKAFIACTDAHRVMAIWLGAAPTSWRGQQDASLQHDQMLALLDVGQSPTYLALKPDGGEVFSVNRDSDSISEISTWTNEVSGTYIIGSKPTRAVISIDDSSLWVTNSGADSATLYSIDDGRLVTGVRTGASPAAIAFSRDEHLLLVADTGSGDVALLRMQSRNGPGLVTLLPAGKHPNDMAVAWFTVK
ncbi:MAG TPA: YncE family protein [Acidobacteriaceae bacterium]|jgi:YVTN family beta-propeller protein